MPVNWTFCPNEACNIDFNTWLALKGVSSVGLIFDCFILLLVVGLKSSEYEDASNVKPAIYIYFNHIVLAGYCLYTAIDGVSLINLGFGVVVMQAYLGMDSYYSSKP